MTKYILFFRWWTIPLSVSHWKQYIHIIVLVLKMNGRENWKSRKENTFGKLFWLYQNKYVSLQP